MRNNDDCPFCGAGNAIRTNLKDQYFLYGAGDDAALLKAAVPVRFCCSCGIEYTDAAGENAREAAVKEHRAERSKALEDQVRTLRAEVAQAEAESLAIEDAKAPF